jgi:RimJ/RimL family protein N-acetyltransferase
VENPKSDASVIVRHVSEDDLAEALELYESVASEGKWIGAEQPVNRDRVLEKWRRQMSDPREAYFVAEVGGRIVGTATLRWVGASEVGMLVASDMRGRGIGSALLTACLEWARAHRVHKIELKVWPHNAAAIALYESFGFETEGYLKRHYKRRSGEIWDCIIMGLQLPPPEVGPAAAP